MTHSAPKKPLSAARIFSSPFLSLYTTVICLIVLCILVLWGTLYRIDHGIYAAKTRFFSSWIVLIAGIVPFPGVLLAAAALILNQAAMLVFKQEWRPAKAGIIITHLGVLVLLVGGGIVSYTARESFLALWEGETSNESLSYHSWDLATWTKTKPGTPWAMSLDTLRTGHAYRSALPGASVLVEDAYPNCVALMRQMPLADSSARMPMPAAIDSIEAQSAASDPSDNIPGVVVTVSAAAGAGTRRVVYGGASEPVCIPCGADTLYCAVRRKPVPLPLALALIKFVKEDYAGTQMARQYRSTVRAKGSDIDREAVISMNKPFRYRHYTFYQSSYSQTGGRRSSTFAVVENRGKWLPYVAGFLLAAGLLLHFCTKLIIHIRKREAP